MGQVWGMTLSGSHFNWTLCVSPSREWHPFSAKANHHARRSCMYDADYPQETTSMAAIVPWSVAGKVMGTVGKPLPEIQMERKSILGDL